VYAMVLAWMDRPVGQSPNAVAGWTSGSDTKAGRSTDVLMTEELEEIGLDERQHLMKETFGAPLSEVVLMLQRGPCARRRKRVMLELSAGPFGNVLARSARSPGGGSRP